MKTLLLHTGNTQQLSNLETFVSDWGLRNEPIRGICQGSNNHETTHYGCHSVCQFLDWNNSKKKQTTTAFYYPVCKMTWYSFYEGKTAKLPSNCWYIAAYTPCPKSSRIMKARALLALYDLCLKLSAYHFWSYFFRRSRKPFRDKGHTKLFGLNVTTDQQCSLLARKMKIRFPQYRPSFRISGMEKWLVGHMHINKCFN